MIKITKTEISITEFRLLSIGHNWHITTSISPYLIEPSDGGITFLPELDIKNILDGYLIYTQVCNKHELKITLYDEKYFEFTNKQVLKDTHLPSDCHYSLFRIKENQILKNGLSEKSNPVFFDAPHRELFNHWKKFQYKIQFETWLQYKILNFNNNQIAPLLSFNWDLEVSAEKENSTWNLISNKCSSITEINASIKNRSSEAKPLIPCDSPQLHSEVHKFFLQNLELLPPKPNFT